jgi:hypothetical protein
MMRPGSVTTWCRTAGKEGGGGSDEICVDGVAGRGKEKENPHREQRASWEFNNAVIGLRNVFLDASARDRDSLSTFFSL